MTPEAFAKEMDKPYWLKLHGTMGRFYIEDVTGDWRELTSEQARVAFAAIAAFHNDP